MVWHAGRRQTGFVFRGSTGIVKDRKLHGQFSMGDRSFSLNASLLRTSNGIMSRETLADSVGTHAGGEKPRLRMTVVEKERYANACYAKEKKGYPELTDG